MAARVSSCDLPHSIPITGTWRQVHTHWHTKRRRLSVAYGSTPWIVNTSTVRSELHYYTTGDFNMSISKKQNEPSLHYSTTSSFQKCMLKFNKWQYLHYNTTGTFFAHLLIFFRRSTVRSELHYYTTGDFNMYLSKRQNEPSLHYNTTSNFQKCMLKFNKWKHLHYNTTGNFFAHLLIFFEGPQFDQCYTATLQVILRCLSQRSKMSLVYTTALQAVF